MKTKIVERDFEKALSIVEDSIMEISNLLPGVGINVTLPERYFTLLKSLETHRLHKVVKKYKVEMSQHEEVNSRILIATV